MLSQRDGARTADWAFERQVIELPVNGVMRDVIVTAGKEAVYDVLEAASGLPAERQARYLYLSQWLVIS